MLLDFFLTLRKGVQHYATKLYERNITLKGDDDDLNGSGEKPKRA